MHFGFSYVGAVFLLMLMIPNIIWASHKPAQYEDYAVHENKLLLALERSGEVLVTVLVLIFDDFNIHMGLPWLIWLILSFVLMILYEIYWIRYFRSGRTMRDFYSSLWGIPVAGATLPVAAFLLLGIYGRNPFLILADLILGVGHIGIHLCHRREIR